MGEKNQYDDIQNEDVLTTETLVCSCLRKG